MEVKVSCKTWVDVTLDTADAFITLVRSLGLIEAFKETQGVNYFSSYNETTGETELWGHRSNRNCDFLYDSTQGEVYDELQRLAKDIFPGWDGTL